MVGIRQSKEDWFRDSKQYPAECLIGRYDAEDGRLEVLSPAEAAAMLGIGSGDHNSLSGLQGGQSGEYYHLTLAQYTGLNVVDRAIPFGNSSNNLTTDVVNLFYDNLNDILNSKNAQSKRFYAAWDDEGCYLAEFGYQNTDETGIYESTADLRLFTYDRNAAAAQVGDSFIIDRSNAVWMNADFMIAGIVQNASPLGINADPSMSRIPMIDSDGDFTGGYTTVDSLVQSLALGLGAYKILATNNLSQISAISGNNVVPGLALVTVSATSLPTMGSVSSAGIQGNAVTTSKIAASNVTNAKLANMTESTIKGKSRGSATGDPEDLTSLQVHEILMPFSTITYSQGQGAY